MPIQRSQAILLPPPIPEAELRAQATEQNLRDLENRISRDVQVAWLNANTAYQLSSL